MKTAYRSERGKDGKKGRGFKKSGPLLESFKKVGRAAALALSVVAVTGVLVGTGAGCTYYTAENRLTGRDGGKDASSIDASQADSGPMDASVQPDSEVVIPDAEVVPDAEVACSAYNEVRNIWLLQAGHVDSIGGYDLTVTAVHSTDAEVDIHCQNTGDLLMSGVVFTLNSSQTMYLQDGDKELTVNVTMVLQGFAVQVDANVDDPVAP